MTKCSHSGCDRPVKAHELCQMHYDRERSRAGRKREDRVLATRARNRANAALIKRHPDEFATLLQEATAAVQEEHERIVAMAQKMGVEPSNDRQVFRLKRGPVADDERTEDRVELSDPTVCSCCSRIHERDHGCPECGTTLGMPVERATSPADVRTSAAVRAKTRERETADVLAEYDEFEIGDRYRVRVPPSPDEYEWDDEETA